MRRSTRVAGVTAAVLALGPTTAMAEERTCRGALGAVTVDNLRVPDGATCTLHGTRVQGTAKVETAATLDARDIRVVGNVQAENATRVILRSSRVGGSVQVKQGGGAEVYDTHVNADIQLDANDGALQRLVRNAVGGNIQLMSNRGGVEVSRNVIDGNLQCKSNSPAPTGGGNVVKGSAEDQCSRLVGGDPASAGPGAPGGEQRGDDRSGVVLAKGTLRASRKGVVRVGVRCVGARCAGKLRIARAGRTLGSARFSRSAGASKVEVRLNRRGLRIARAGKRVRVVCRSGAHTARRTTRLAMR
jgi:hypothetical protein